MQLLYHYVSVRVWLSLSLPLCVSLYLDNTFKSQMTYKVCLMLAAPFLSCSVACLWCASQSSHTHRCCCSEGWKNSIDDSTLPLRGASPIHGATVCVWPWQMEREVVPLNWALFRVDSGHSIVTLLCVPVDGRIHNPKLLTLDISILTF